VAIEVANTHDFPVVAGDPTRIQELSGYQGRAAHIPHSQPPVCVLPHESALAVAIEVGCTHDLPAGSGWLARIQEFTAGHGCAVPAPDSERPTCVLTHPGGT